MPNPDPAPAAPAVRPVSLAAIAGLFVASIALRPQLLAIGPLLPLIRVDLGLSAGLGGLLTSIPVLCMGLFAPIGPRLAARVGSRNALAFCLVAICLLGILRAVVPAYPLVLLATFGIGVAIGGAGPIPSIVVSQRINGRPALGTGAYAGGIVTGSTIAAAIAVPLAVGGDWRVSLAAISAASIGAVVAWIALVRPERTIAPVRRGATRLPWRSGTGWLLVALFGLQSVMYYGVVSWLPNVYVERGWSAASAGSLVALFNGIGLFTTIGVPLVADRFGGRRTQLMCAAIVCLVTMIGLVVLPDLAFAWVVVFGLGLGTIFPLVLTLPLDVADDPGQVGSVAALMLLGGYILSSTGPFVLGAARDATGSFTASLWLLVAVAAALVVCCLPLSPSRLRVGIRRPIEPGVGAEPTRAGQ
jgi:CP family cyanate transporter-like MFS transporter